jgi:hypothetical protein
MSFETIAVMAATALIGLVIFSLTVLRALHSWLDLKRAELAREGGSNHALGMIDLSDLKERLRKLEAIAAGVDL